MSKKQHTTIDENFLKEIISQGLPVKQEKSAVKDTSKAKSEKQKATIHKAVSSTKTEPDKSIYEEMFFQSMMLSNRRSVYVSQTTHEKLSRIVSILGNGKVTVSGYVETIIQHHLEKHKDEINELYKNNIDRLL